MPRNQRRLSARGINRSGAKRSSPSSVSSLSSLASSRSSSPSSFTTSSSTTGTSTPNSSRGPSPTGFGKREEVRTSKRSNSSKNRRVSYLSAVENPGSEGVQYVMADNTKPPSPTAAPPTMNWESATSTVSNQHIQRVHDKPTYSSDTHYDADGNPIEGTGRVISHASTEILHDWEPGYEDSRRQQRTQETQRYSNELPDLLAGSHLYETEPHDQYHQAHHIAAPSIPPTEMFTA